MFSFLKSHPKVENNQKKLEKAEISERLSTAYFVLENGVNDFFGGWKKSDSSLLKAHMPEIYPKPENGEIIDWLGIKTDAAYHAWLDISKKGFFLNTELPIPDDMVHAETIEYIALVTAINEAIRLNKDSFTAVELGASYAPWAIAAGVLAKRNKFKKINLIAVEASESMAPKIARHAKMNGLLDDNLINVNSVQGAIASEDGFVFFPKVNVSGDNGGQISTVGKEKDYRGLDLEHEKVKAYSIKTLLKDSPRVDFLHMDIQGAELELLRDVNFLKTLDQKVALFLLATQSRLIEGVALEAMGALGWSLIRERPTMYLQNDRTTDVNGWTLRDGGQIWINRKLC